MMTTRRIKLFFGIFVTFLTLISCANPEKDWNLAARDDTRNAYLEFLAKHPNSAFAEQARTRIDELEVIRAWERAEFKDSLTAYRAFIDKYADSEYAATARKRAKEIQRDERWQKIQTEGNKVALKAFLEEYPDAPQINEARTLLAEIAAAEEAARPKERPGHFRLQLAAFKTAAAAELELRRLVAMAPDTLLGPVLIESPTQANGSNMFLLKTVPMSGAEARNACTTLKKLGQNCLIINR